MRKYLVVGNWKMNGTKTQTVDLLQRLKAMLADLNPKVECVVCPPFPYLEAAHAVVKSSNIRPCMHLGAQNLASSTVAAYTGEVSPAMLREFGCTYVIIGHSERRTLLGETNELIAKKFGVAIEGGLQPILCVGETKEQQQMGQGFEVVSSQIQAVIDIHGIGAFKSAVIAYEPVWAIGTGLTATPDQAHKMHKRIRAKFSEFDAAIAADLRIIYGGSVNPGSAAILFKESEINGALVGGASLNAQDFSDICHMAR